MRSFTLNERRSALASHEEASIGMISPVEWSTPSRYSTDGRWLTVALPVTWQSSVDCLVGTDRTATSLSVTSLPVWAFLASLGTAVITNSERGAATITSLMTSLITSFSTITSTGTSLITSFSTTTSLMTSLITSFSTTIGVAAVPPQARMASNSRERDVMRITLGAFHQRYDMSFLQLNLCGVTVQGQAMSGMWHASENLAARHYSCEVD